MISYLLYLGESVYQLSHSSHDAVRTSCGHGGNCNVSHVAPIVETWSKTSLVPQSARLALESTCSFQDLRPREASRDNAAAIMHEMS